jgi:tRNA-2-methylthio-N6-dimethylallyladenosine synthase
MNEYDSQRLASFFSALGYTQVSSPDEADYALINTCSVREKPQHKVASELGRLKKLRRKNPGLKIGVCGCVAQQEGENLIKNYPQTDFVLGTDAVSRIGEAVAAVEDGRKVCLTEFQDGELKVPVFGREAGPSAFVTIMKGCDNFCSYCIVPYVRGREKSRSLGEILDEIKYLTDKGVKEITLLGQNVNSYGKNLDESLNFPELLKRVNDIGAVRRIRFVTSHPKDFSGELIAAISGLDKVCESLHLPLQAGSSDVLRRMNRKYTYEQYKDKVLAAKEEIKGLALSSDFIVGFPGETEADFEKTLDALREIEYESLFAFNYSVRPGTSAEKFGDDVSLAVKKRRLASLLDLQRGISLKLGEKYVGTEVEVMVEGSSKRDETIYSGRIRQNRVINFTSGELLSVGDIVKVKVEEAKPNSLFGNASAEG